MQKIIYICDECAAEFECDTGLDFKAAWEQAKECEWICYKDGDEWKHKCDECRSQ